MDISTITQNLGTDYVSKVTDAFQSATKSAQGTDADSTFDSIYNSTVNLLNDTNSYIQDAAQAEVDFALGNLTSTHELSAIQQKANISLQYTVAIRDKVLEAYKEIMNMSM